MTLNETTSTIRKVFTTYLNQFSSTTKKINNVFEMNKIKNYQNSFNKSNQSLLINQTNSNLSQIIYLNQSTQTESLFSINTNYGTTKSKFYFKLW